MGRGRGWGSWVWGGSAGAGWRRWAGRARRRGWPGGARARGRVGGWGRGRLGGVVGSGGAGVVAVADAGEEALEGVAALAPGARRVRGLEALLECGLDGVVIATPSAMHAEQAGTALERGLAVFCQKPL